MCMCDRSLYMLTSDILCLIVMKVFFFFKQKTAYEMRISDWSSDVCSSDLSDDHHFGTTIEGDRRRTFFGEASFAGKTGRTSWLAGAAFQADIFRPVQFSGFNYSYTVLALFAHVAQDALNDLKLAASARRDAHSSYGSQIGRAQGWARGCKDR